MKKFFIILFILFCGLELKAGWKQVESRNFILIYDSQHEVLVTHILESAENSFNRLSYLFGYKPEEKIVLNLFDYSDYGSAAATTLPMNYIKLELEPLEPGFENTPYTERIEWLLNHELVHIFVNDYATKYEQFNRSIFQKVVPEKENPITILYSLITSSNRFTPRWHQEAIAVFFETWLSGGFGRTMGSFDEMYFRSLVFESKEFLDWEDLETYAENDNFLLGSLYYLYGTRFITYLSLNYSLEKIINWYNQDKENFYSSFQSRFKSSFNMTLDQAWKEFIDCEKNFQHQNIDKLSSSALTKINYFRDVNPGMVSSPVYDIRNNSLFFAGFSVGSLASLLEINITSQQTEVLTSLPTPGKYQVSSLAFDPDNDKLFFTINNNNLYRDIYEYDLRSGEKKLLFENCRIGNLSYSHNTKELWGIKHEDGRAILMRSVYPYKDFFALIAFNFEDEVQHIAVSPSGKYLAAVIHRPDGSQFLTYGDCSNLAKTYRYTRISSNGSPEFPSWSSDDKTIYWNSYVNGVSNIYKFDLESKKTQALTHTIRGLFCPLEINRDTLFAYEFTSDGFVPVLVQNKIAEKLEAITYLGQVLSEKSPEISLIYSTNNDDKKTQISRQSEYNAIGNLNNSSFAPIVSGFKDKAVIGLFTKFNDPLLYHDLSIEFGFSPGNKNRDESIHLKLNYEYKGKYGIEMAHNPTDFFDLLNDRKKSISGNFFRLFNNYYWKYDIPHKITQETEFIYYNGITALNDNLIKINIPDVLFFQSNFNSKNLRRTIGFCDYESGLDYNISALSFAGLKDGFNSSFGGYTDFNLYNLWLADHNVGIISFAGGYFYENKKVPFAMFYFGSFGNRSFDNEPVKQYRDVFSFPGTDIFSIPTDRFIKISFENNFPPIRFYSFDLFNQFLSHLDYSIFSQTLAVSENFTNIFTNLGVQFNLVFEHWYNLESTLSFGYSKSWSGNASSDEMMLSFKLLRN